MRPRAAVTAAALVMAAAALAPCRREARPNLVFISLDTLRRDRLNCYGYAARRVSPAMDALAAESVVFDNAVAASPWTTPSHMTLLTSLMPSSHGVITPFQKLLRDVRTGSVERLPEARVTLAEALAARGYATAAFTGGVTMDPVIGFGQGFATYDVSMFKVTDPAMRRMKDWVAAHREGPFFLFWHTFETHAPYLDTRFVREVLPEARAREVEAAMAELRGRFLRADVPPELYARLAALRSAALAGALYDAGVLSADGRVGELVSFLREAGLYDRTAIVLTSDHGEELWDREPGDFFGSHGHSLYEEMIGVPLVLKLPGQAHAGRRVGPPAPAVDVMPTVLDVLGIPAAAAAGMEGRSLRPVWEGRETTGRHAFSEAMAFEWEKKSVRADRYKYVLSVPPQEVERHGRRYLPARADWQLFDLVADPGERKSLLPPGGLAAAARPAAGPPVPAAVVEALDRELRRYVTRHFGRSEQAVVPAETVEKLRALGYVR